MIADVRLACKARPVHMQGIEPGPEEVAMLTAAIHAMLARALRETAILRRFHARKHSNAMAIRHLEALPAYLRRDIGLADGADIAAAVEHGIPRRAPDADGAHCPGILPHAI
jgi:hypothetical protein